MNTVKGLIKYEENLIRENQMYLDKWKKVVILTKKDGTEFRRLTQTCIENAQLKTPFYETDADRKVLYIQFIDEETRDMAYSEVMAYGLNRSLPDDDPRKIPGDDFKAYTLSPEEMRAAIASKIEHLEHLIYAGRKSIAWLEQNESKLENSMLVMKGYFQEAGETVEFNHLYEGLKSMVYNRLELPV